jgi:uncharacterized protein YndB with AHSA1/START domain
MSDSANGVIDTQPDGRRTIRFERRLNHPVEQVWAALTQPSELIAWWGDADVELAEGGTFTMRWLNTDENGERAVMTATITRLEPPRLLELSGDIHGVLRWELAPDGETTVLRFSTTLELPEEFRTKALAGWHTHLDLLDDALAGRPTDLVNIEERWEPIHQRYVS